MQDILVQLLGRTLRAVTEARHWRGGVRGDADDALIDFWLCFEGLPAVHVCGDDSGTRLLLSFDEPYDSYELGQYGEFRVGPAIAGDLLAEFVDHRLVDAVVLGDRAGVVLRFEDRDLVAIEDNDDFVLSAGPAPAGQSVGTWLATRPTGR